MNDGAGKCGWRKVTMTEPASTSIAIIQPSQPNPSYSTMMSPFMEVGCNFIYQINASTTRPKSLHQVQSTLHPPSIMNLIAKLMAPGLMFAGIRSNRPMSSPPKPLSLICTQCVVCANIDTYTQLMVKTSITTVPLPLYQPTLISTLGKYVLFIVM